MRGDDGGGLMDWIAALGWGGLLLAAAVYGLGYRDANGRKPPAFLLFGGLALGYLLLEVFERLPSS